MSRAHSAHRVSRAAQIATAGLLTACASGSKKPSTEPEPLTAASIEKTLDSAGLAPGVISGRTSPISVAGRDRQLLTKDEIRATQYTNLYDVVQALRGNWVRTRAADSFGKSSVVQVYLDAQRLNGLEDLRTMSPLNVESVRFFDPIQATARWGMDHGSGAIFVRTAKR
jgi:hypothetical protein